jgi:RND family efflux transporter MFP subunit
MMTIAAQQAQLRLERTVVRSPVDGVVMQRLIEPGGKLMAVMDDKGSSQVARLYDPKKLQVRADVPLSEAARVGVGQDVRVTVEILRDKVFKGKVTRIANEADIQKNTLQVKIALLDPLPELKPEMLARAQFVASDTGSKNAVAKYRLFVVEDAIQKSGERGVVWIVDKGRGTATRREVSLGASRESGWQEVSQGLQLGDVVIVGDTSSLSEGQSVRIEEEASGPQGKQENPHGVH